MVDNAMTPAKLTIREFTLDLTIENNKPELFINGQPLNPNLEIFEHQDGSNYLKLNYGSSCIEIKITDLKKHL